jgi:hypothetical protein
VRTKTSGPALDLTRRLDIAEADKTFDLAGALKDRGAVQRRDELESDLPYRVAADSVTTFEFRSIRIGYGMSVFVAVLFAMFFMIGMTTGYCVIRYIAISSYCQLAAASS